MNPKLPGNIMMKIVLGISQEEPNPGAPIRARDIFLKTLSGSLKESFSIPNPAEANASRVNLETTQVKVGITQGSEFV